jgi:signal transduction histidine kinase
MQSLSEGKMMQTLQGVQSFSEKARQAKLQLIEHMSHELRIPLHTILGFAQLLERCSDDTTLGEERESIDLILTASRQLLRSIDSLIDLAAIETGSIEVGNCEDALMDRSPS